MRTFFFVGGGTGGHLVPGLAIAERLMARAGAEVSCRFLCSSRPIDERVLRDQGFAFEPLPAQPVGFRPLALLRFLRGYGPSIRRVRGLIRDEQKTGASVCVVAMGGFVAAPGARAAVAQGVPLTLVNLDAVPGKANRLIARRAGRVFTAAPVSGYHSWLRVPPVVREPQGGAAASRAVARERIGLDPARPVLLITGGSQGAGSINSCVRAIVESPSGLAALLDGGWQVLHQTGSDDHAALTSAYERAGIPARVQGFVPGLGAWWAASDLALSRSGAGSIADAWSCAVPALFLPYPYHKDQHQRVNARVLVEAGGAEVAEDRIAEAENLRTIGPLLEALLKDEPRRTRMRTAITALGPVDGADRIAAALLEGP
ncbi:MAG: UDP-N-acetylglucosamine--N-acetylmuramyl-(pentapeptide) pyrophosphoryl-undecaprenol N-acetylglucosamine transferase [Phycisphaerales bacterium]